MQPSASAVLHQGGNSNNNNFASSGAPPPPSDATIQFALSTNAALAFLNSPAIKDTARSVANAIDFPDTMLPEVGEFLYSRVGGRYFFDTFHQISFSLAGPDNIERLRNYFYNDFFHPSARDLPFSDPMTIIFWLVFYLFMIGFLWFVGKSVAYPSRLELKYFSLGHNAFLCLLSFYMGVSFFFNVLAEPEFSFADLPITKRKPFLKIVWLFTLSKIPEFIDTFIMVLKQNYHQVTFLHVYHHLSILVFCYLFGTSAPGGDGYLSGMMNSFPVHTFMYLYYFLASFAGKTGPLRSFLNSIKFFITKGQLTQFTINFAHGIYMVFVVGENSRFPNTNMKFMMGYMVTMLMLFGNFLIQGQRAAAREKKLAKALAEKNNGGGKQQDQKQQSAISSSPSDASPDVDSSSKKIKTA